MPLDFYTADDHHVDLKQRCSNHSHGQLNNEYVQSSLKLGHFNEVVCELHGSKKWHFKDKLVK